MTASRRRTASGGLAASGRRAAWLLCALLGLAACADPFERFLANTVDHPAPDGPALRGPVADLHADSLMWARDLTEHLPGRGHADLPRLAEGGVVLQVFNVFTVTPPADAACTGRAPDGGAREGCVSATGPNMTAAMNLLIHGRLAEATSIRRVVEARAAAFHDLVRRSQTTGPPLLPIFGVEDLRRLVAERRAGRPVIGALLGLEGAHPLEDGTSIAAEVSWLHGLGYRLVGIVHRFDNGFAGSSEGVAATGLTPRGLELAQEVQRRRMVLDVAHLSSAAIRQLGAAPLDRPLIYSHGGLSTPCRASEECDADRNLTPEDAAVIARSGGVIGIGYWHEAVGRRGLGSIVTAMAATRDALSAQGIARPLDHLAIGSDFDGFVRTAVDAQGHPLVLGAIETEFGPGAARRIGWLNACRALARALGAAAGDTGFCDSLP